MVCFDRPRDVERYMNKKTFNHSVSLNKRKISIGNSVKALNSITTIKEHQNRSMAISQNGYFMVFEGDYLYNIFKPSRNLETYLKDSAALDKVEIIKWKFITFT